MTKDVEYSNDLWYLNSYNADDPENVWGLEGFSEWPTTNELISIINCDAEEEDEEGRPYLEDTDLDDIFPNIKPEVPFSIPQWKDDQYPMSYVISKTCI